ncbi:fec operon regulator FecR [compost metagenome]
MEKEKFILLLSKKLSKEISASEQAHLEQALQHETYRVLAHEMENYFVEKKDVDIILPPIDATWQKIAEAENNAVAPRFDFSAPKRTLFSYALVRVAAIVTLVLGIGLVAYHFSNRSQTTLFTATDHKIFKILDDGTRIWLNKESSITYNENFGKHQREITLQGEAYFDVVKNAVVPLIVHVGAPEKGIDIEVKGTAFNVNAYPKNSGIAVALLRGSIAVTDRQNVKNSVLLKPNDKLVFVNQAALTNQNRFQIVALKPELMLREASWAADTLVFHKERLVDLAPKLAKKYDLKIEIRNEKLKEKRFSGTFINETIYQALEALKLSYPLTYTVDKQLVIIKN